MKPRVIDRLGRLGHRKAPTLIGLALVGLSGLAGLAGCFVDVDLGGSRLSCNDGQCPDGFDCVEARCVPEGQGGVEPDDDSGSGGDEDAASQPPPDDADAGEPSPDAAPPDAPPPDAPPPPTPCDEQYSRAPGYELCAEDRATCEFFVNSEVAISCDQHCADFGGLCLGARNDVVGGDVCAEGGEPLDCAVAMNNSLICICTLGSGF